MENIIFKLVPVIGIAMVMLILKGKRAFNSDIAETLGSKSVGAKGPRVPTWLGIILIIAASAVTFLVIFSLLSSIMAGK